jgi:L-lactate permease
MRLNRTMIWLGAMVAIAFVTVVVGKALRPWLGETVATFARGIVTFVLLALFLKKSWHHEAISPKQKKGDGDEKEKGTA